MNEILLKGCAPTPLAHYLKALGILRIVAEQKDKHAKGAWCEDGFILKTTLREDELCRFFLEEYQPSPILAPWNGGSGFYYQETKTNELDPETGKKKKTGVRGQATTATKTLDTILNSKTDRLKNSSEIIADLKRVISVFDFKESPKDRKMEFIKYLRGEIDENYLDALDSCVAITDEQPLFPPIFGSGGNDGNLDFTNNFYQQIIRMIDVDTGKSTSIAKSEIGNAFFNKALLGLEAGAIGQFAPGHAGGPNSSTGFEGNGGVNGWDYILMIEGALLFASSVTRRLESNDNATLSFPFTVRMTGGGAGSASSSDESDSRNEIWMPLWNRFASISELKTLLREGRASLDKKRCRDGLDFARSVALLGTDRGIASFQRFGFFMRSGKAYHATPLGRIFTCNNPNADLINDLETGHWLNRIRMAARAKEADTSTKSMVRMLENSLFDLTRHPTGELIKKLICLIGNICLKQSKSRKLSEKNTKLPLLDSSWLIEADHADEAFRIACAFSSIGFEGSPSMRSHIFPLESINGWEIKTDGKSKLCTWTHAPFTTEICMMAERRLLLSRQGKIRFSPKGSSPVNETTIAAFLDNPEMDKNISDLLPGLCLVKKHFPLQGSGKDNYIRTPLIYRFLKPFFCAHSDLVEAGILPEDVQLHLEPEIIRYLVSNQIERAVRTASRRLRIAGFKLPKSLPDSGNLDGKRLLTALMIPIYPQTLKSMASATFNIKDIQTVNFEK